MRKISDLMEELGFNAEGSDEVKIAFIKNLVKAAYGIDAKVDVRKESVKSIPPAQMSFTFDEIDEDDKSINENSKNRLARISRRSS